MTAKSCEECGNYQNCRYFLNCAGDPSHASKCPGFFIEKPFQKFEIDLSKVNKPEGVKSVRKSKKSNSNKRERMENRLPFLL